PGARVKLDRGGNRRARRLAPDRRNDLGADDIVAPWQPNAALRIIAPGDDDGEVIFGHDDEELAAIAGGGVTFDGARPCAQAVAVPGVAASAVQIKMGKAPPIEAGGLLVDGLDCGGRLFAPGPRDDAPPVPAPAIEIKLADLQEVAGPHLDAA